MEHFGMNVRTTETHISRENYISLASTKKSMLSSSIRRLRIESFSNTEIEAYKEICSRTDLKSTLKELNKYKRFEKKINTNNEYALKKLTDYKSSLINELAHSISIKVADDYHTANRCYPFEIDKELNNALKGRALCHTKEFHLAITNDEILHPIWTDYLLRCEEIEKTSITELLYSKIPCIVFRLQSYINNPFRQKEHSIYDYLISCEIDSNIFYPWVSPIYKEIQQNKALYNYDLNFEHYKSLDASKFQYEIEQFKKDHSEFIEIHSFSEVKDMPGIYVMILDNYCQIYIGITSVSIPKRIKQHWQSQLPLDRLIFGGVNNSIISINSFRHLDTTRILACPILNCDDDQLKEQEYELVSSSFSKEFLINRCAGGLSSFLGAIVERRTRIYKEYADHSLNRKEWDAFELCSLLHTTLKSNKEKTTIL